MKRFLKKDKNVISIALFFLLSSAIFLSTSIGKKITNFGTLKEGIATCFLRVNQTYTSKIIGSGQSYLNSEFIKNSENCFAETLSYLDNKFKNDFFKIRMEANKLSSNVHWFHQKITNSDTLSGTLDSTFSDLEEMKENIITLLNNKNNSLIKSKATIKTIYYILTVLIILAMTWVFIDLRQKRKAKKSLETRASNALTNQSFVNYSKSGEIIYDALIESDMTNCSNLFVKLNDSLKTMYVSKAYVEQPTNSSDENKTKENIITDDEFESLTEDTHNLNFSNNPAMENFEKLMMSTIDSLASKLFSSGTILDLNIEQDLFVFGTQEVIEQVFYHSLICLMNLQCGRIEISSKKISDNLIIDIINTKLSFSQEDLTNTPSIEKNILFELIKDLNGQISFDNISTGTDTKQNARIKIVLKIAVDKVDITPTNSPKLITLEKGKKRDILKRLEEMGSI